jgi:hypothetical protein
MLCLDDGLNHQDFILVQGHDPIRNCRWRHSSKVSLNASQEPTEALLLKMAICGQGFINTTLPH